MVQNKEFFYRRLHSLLGVLPLGVFLLMHLFVNSFAMRGEESFNQAAGFMGNLPAKVYLEIIVIALPILFHAIYGLYIAFTFKTSVAKHGYFRNWMFVLQRITGITTVIYVVWHVWTTTVQHLFFGADVNFDMMVANLDSPIKITAYFIGLIGAMFHFSNGLWSFLITWGITVSPKSQKWSTIITMGLFVILSILCVKIMLAFM